MPDAQNNFKGQGWSRKKEEAWTRVFGRKTQEQAEPRVHHFMHPTKVTPVQRDVVKP